MKRTISLILSLLMVLSLFTGLSISAAARASDLADTAAAIISAADISVTAPHAGDTPDFAPSADNADFSIASVKWSSWETGSAVVMSSSDIFRAGFNYTLTVEITPDSGYQFATADSKPALTAAVNGSKATVNAISGYSSADRIKVIKTFVDVADTGIKSVEASIAAPVPDEYPSYAASIPESSAGYAVEDFDGVNYKDGVCWYDDTAGTFIMSGEPVRFIAGHQYTVTVSLVPKTGYTFYKTTSSVSGKINGKTATVVDFNDPDSADLNIGLKYQFTCEKETISSIDVSVTPPVTGLAPSFSASENSPCYDVDTTLNTTTFKNGVEWYDLTAKSTVATDGSVSFIDGHHYLVTVFVKANPSYEFPATAVTGTVNGQSGGVYKMHGYDETVFRTVEYEFIAANAVTSVEVNGITEPKAGQKPSYFAFVPSGAKYKVEYDYSKGDWVNGVIWYNETDKKYMSASDTFESGKQNRVTVSLIKIEDPFFENVTGTLNGETAEIKKYHEGTSNIGVYRTFTCKSSAILGDADGDKIVSIVDATVIQRRLASLPTSAFIEEAADADEDGTLTILDATAIQRHLASLPTNKNIGQSIQ
jgi:hypothetical protein